MSESDNGRRWTVLVESKVLLKADSWGDFDAAVSQAEYFKRNGWDGLAVSRVWVAQEITTT